jgi:hypothetical protein
MTPDLEPRSGSTSRREEARATITKTTITPAPGSDVAADDAPRSSLFDRVRGRRSTDDELAPPAAPIAAANKLRLAMAFMLSALCLLTVGGAVLVLLLWQQDRASGVLTTQLERTWNLFDALRIIERWLAFAVLPVATLWIAVATLNVRRATGVRRNPILAALSLPVGVLGAWLIGREIVADAGDWVGRTSGFVLQAIFLAIPFLALLRVAQVADSRSRPLRVTYIVSVVHLAQLQFLGGLSNIDQSSSPDEWARLGSYLIIGGLIQVLGALSANEAARSIEEGTENRYQLRSRFGESLLAQADRGLAV